MHVLDALTYHARVCPNDIAVIHRGGHSSFAELHNSVIAVSARLRHAGLQPGQVLAIYVADPLLHLVLILGAMREALPSFSGHPNFDPPPGVAIAAYACDRQAPFMSGAAVIAVDAHWLGIDGAPPPQAPRRFAGPQALARVIASSGTTGRPKAIGLSMALVGSRIAVPTIFGEHRLAPSLSLIGLSSSIGFRHCLAQIQIGQAQVLPSPDIDILSLLRIYGVRSLLGSPVQLNGLVDLVDRGALRFPALQEVRFAGSTLAPAAVARLRSRLCANVSGLYGSAEASGVAYAPAELLQRLPGCAGFMSPWAQVDIVDESDGSLPPGTEGTVRLRSQLAVSHYLDDAPGQSPGFKDGWFYPGDVGVITPEGALRIVGRTAEIINAGGVKVSPDVIANTLLAIDGIAEAAAFGVDHPDRPTEIWAAVVSARPIDERAVIEACRATLSSRAPHRIVRVDRLPRNAMGKVVTAELQRSVAGA